MRFSIITCTFNRAGFLPATYDSLRSQSFRDFEWIVVDDGSTDETRELIASWKTSFAIRYVWKPNGGMHTALNIGNPLAQGDFVTHLDSDDYLLPGALERFDYHWRRVADGCGSVISLCYQEDGCSILGKPFPRDEIDTSSLRDALPLTRADLCAFYRAHLVRNFVFPVFPGEKYMTPGLLFYRILREHPALFFNEPLKVVRYASGHLSGHACRSLRWSSPRGLRLHHFELAKAPIAPWPRLKSAVKAAVYGSIAAIKSMWRVAY